MTRLSLISAPKRLPVSLEDVYQQLRLDADESGHLDDELLLTLIQSATEELDGVNGYLGRALVTQTWELTLDKFPSQITLPLPPLQSVDAINYTDDDGAEQILEASRYRVLSGEPSTLAPAYGEGWPNTLDDVDAVRIQFTAGYGDDGLMVPARIRSFILMHVTTLYEHRKTAGESTPVSDFAWHSLESYRVNL
nr:hypothetical protein 23 [bacterium]